MDCWDLIDAARTDAAQTADWPSGMQIGNALTVRLRHLHKEDVLAFDRWIRREAEHADLWECCAASFLVSGYLSDDGFTEFRYGLIALGRHGYAAVLADPDTGLAGLPVVRAMAQGHVSHFTIHGEQVAAAAREAYGQHYWNDRHDVPVVPRPWSGRFGAADMAQIPDRMPQLYGLFPRVLTHESGVEPVSRW